MVSSPPVGRIKVAAYTQRVSGGTEIRSLGREQDLTIIAEAPVFVRPDPHRITVNPA